MDIFSFALNIGVALFLGGLIGLERQFRQHPAGLRTNALVSVGAALFVSLTHLIGDESSPTRIASYIVSGVGFLGGGVILREGMTVKGMATAATLWCSAAIGTLSGAGYPWHALIGTLAVLSLHVLFRPLGRWIDARVRLAVNVEMIYRLRVLCDEKHEGIIRTILLRHVNTHPGMIIQGIATQDDDHPDKTAVVADIFSLRRNDRAMEDLMSRLNIEPTVTAVRWEHVS
ncbi:MAG TPA: MgtC/SapB family protein [Gemmataceae bacterium]|jgi:putative Mg2+ transporter-C (MgtC) family protein